MTTIMNVGLMFEVVRCYGIALAGGPFQPMRLDMNAQTEKAYGDGDRRVPQLGNRSTKCSWEEARHGRRREAQGCGARDRLAQISTRTTEPDIKHANRRVDGGTEQVRLIPG